MIERMNDKTRAIVTETVDSIEDIATLPEVTVKIIEVVDDSESNPDQLYEVIKHDPALVARVLRIVNSAFYGLPGQVSNIKRAIALLGLAAIKNIAVAASMSTILENVKDRGAFKAKDLWRHSMAVAVASRKIGGLMDPAPNGDEMFMMGLIHDLGLIVESPAFPDELSRICEQCNGGQPSFLDLEQEIIGATHQDFGSALTLKWRFPFKLRAGIASHHTPGAQEGASRELAAILALADTICCEEGLGFSLTVTGQAIDNSLYKEIGIDLKQCDAIREGLEEEVEEALAVFSAKD